MCAKLRTARIECADLLAKIMPITGYTCNVKILRFLSGILGPLVEAIRKHTRRVQRSATGGALCPKESRIGFRF